MSVKVTFDLASSNAAVAVDVISANSEEGSCESIPDDWKPSFSSGNMLSTQWMDTPVGERSGSGSVAEGALTGMEGDDVGDGIEAMAV